MNFRLTKNDFTGPFIDFLTIFNNMLLTVVRQEVSNFDSSVVVHELELAMHRALYGCLCSQVECRRPLLVFINTYSKPDGIMKNMVIDDRLLSFGSLFTSLSATQFLL